MVLPCLMEINPLNDEGTGMMLPCPYDCAYPWDLQQSIPTSR